MLIGREDEFGQIESLLLNAFAKGSSASLSIYISGPPGTGKTRTVKAVVQKLQKQRKNVIKILKFSSNF
jgi:Cdc6-like AAA superfamily ATPase